ncbi:hypothetical protein Enr13x_65440 [Stieleria neptunia]|uniref:Uncharacterized protein n=1 Tax=Stieleria neptunia TaxID=2527979 RepID=A0A518I0J7_9BACT|nr:hypothetical protein Enr13x_65440 [Stieleria neptunia]
MRGFSYQEYEGNTSSIIMIGEVRSQFEPWGKPNTYRSVELGLNRHPRGFGGPSSRDSVMFLMTDGSVRTIRADDQRHGRPRGASITERCQAVASSDAAFRFS